MKVFLYARRTLALAVGVYLGLMFIRHGVDKFDPAGFWAEPFERWGYPVWLRVLVGAIETGGGVALVIPWLATWGGLAVAVVMGGAMVTRAGTGNWGDVLWIAVYAAGCLWIAWEWRRWRLPRRAVKPTDAEPSPAV